MEIYSGVYRGKMEFSSWLLERYLEWQNNLGKLKSVTDFAAWVGVSQPVVSKYLNRKGVPGEDNAYLFYLKYGEEVYEILDMEPPDFLQRYVQASWHLLPEKAKDDIKKIVKKSLDERGRKNMREEEGKLQANKTNNTEANSSFLNKDL